MKTLEFITVCSYLLFIIGCNTVEEAKTSLVEDCNGVLGGTAIEDNCGVCDTDFSNNCIQDCNNVWGGKAFVDNCGTCDDDPTNDCIKDCNNEWNGRAVEDHCGTCFVNEDARDEYGCRLMFLTEEIWTGNLGGLSGADEKCQIESMEANLSGTFKAWLSGPDESPSQWQYALSRSASIHITRAVPDENGIIGTEVAENWEKLLAVQSSENGLKRQINYFADGSENTSNEIVWTGTKTDGTAAENQAYCQNATSRQAWSSDDAFNLALIGYHQTEGPDWTAFTTETCDQAFRFYCVQISYSTP